ncbi:multidrug efflux system domain protein, partial [Vibrio parahaemolyticus V-223/04]
TMWILTARKRNNLAFRCRLFSKRCKAT